MSANERLDALLEAEAEAGRELAVELVVATQCMWSGELRWTPKPNDLGRADVSLVLYVVGAAGPEQAIERLLDAFERDRERLSLMSR